MKFVDPYTGVVVEKTPTSVTRSSKCLDCGQELSGSYQRGRHSTCPDPVPPTQPSSATPSPANVGELALQILDGSCGNQLTITAACYFDLQRQWRESDEELRERCRRSLRARPPENPADRGLELAGLSPPSIGPVTVVTSAAQARELFGPGYYDSWFRPSRCKVFTLKREDA